MNVSFLKFGFREKCPRIAGSQRLCGDARMTSRPSGRIHGSHPPMPCRSLLCGGKRWTDKRREPFAGARIVVLPGLFELPTANIDDPLTERTRRAMRRSASEAPLTILDGLVQRYLKILPKDQAPRHLLGARARVWSRGRRRLSTRPNMAALKAKARA